MNWIVWNKESRHIHAFGTEENMRKIAKRLNSQYQTDAHVAQEFKSEL